ncbi:MAG: pentapeptide repeat-containing protein [Acidobacteria bacterium]|nr:pentapeptide repeat-containing protein [Acidobacteriota bacterium]
MPKRDATTPRLSPVVLPPLGDADGFEDRDRFDGLRLADVDASGVQLTGAVFDECLLQAVTLDDARLDGARIVDSVLDGVTATSLRAARLTSRDVRIEHCRLGAAEWFEADLRRVEFIGCRIDYLGLTDATLEDVRFIDCTIGDLDLRGATVRRTAIVASRVRELSVHGAHIEHLDLRGADLDGIDHASGLSGAIISTDQLPRFAPLFAEALGLTVA